MFLFLIGACRAIVEMLALCLIAQGFLYLLAGRKRGGNPVYQLFALITRGPRQLCARLLPCGASVSQVGIVCFLILAVLWVGLAGLRKFH
ncbi:MAG: hypothetical protein ACM3X0_09225 [Bacteroidota bacterium]